MYIVQDEKIEEQIVKTGVGGWLRLLILRFLIGPFFDAGRIHNQIAESEKLYPLLQSTDNWHTYTTSTWAVVAIYTAISLYAGYGLAHGKNLAVVTRAKIILWVLPTGSLVLTFLLPITIFGKSFFDAEFFSSFSTSIIIALIWTIYLSKSKRVHSTYSKHTIESKYNPSCEYKDIEDLQRHIKNRIQHGLSYEQIVFSFNCQNTPIPKEYNQFEKWTSELIQLITENEVSEATKP